MYHPKSALLTAQELLRISRQWDNGILGPGLTGGHAAKGLRGWWYPLIDQIPGAGSQTGRRLSRSSR